MDRQERQQQDPHNIERQRLQQCSALKPEHKAVERYGKEARKCHQLDRTPPPKRRHVTRLTSQPVSSAPQLSPTQQQHSRDDASRKHGNCNA